ncbi:hypothetical protein [Polyangium sorediatum]|uniref:Uncharacterized protein n=1 Tax=Polyangium sorediatum TaxID=889274 RepID=A0ABT6NL48_9BACT|nr:hypothetical protein [Polyangium sorediatum]MDI1429042.1 hypothetical protein [Polyangium sorediatum]
MIAARVRSSAPETVPWRKGPRSSAAGVLERLPLLNRAEMADALDMLRAELAMRGDGHDVRPLLLALERLAPIALDRGAPGVPLVRVRQAFPLVSRGDLDAALLDAEARRLVALVPADYVLRGIERAAALPTLDRGLLYYCAPPDSGSLPPSRRTVPKALALMRELAKREDTAEAFAKLDAWIVRLLEARHAPLSTDGREVLRKIGSFAASYQGLPGVPFSVLRYAFAEELPRPAFDRVVLALEAERRLRLSPLFPGEAFADPCAAIEDPRGQLYFCAADLGRR